MKRRPVQYVMGIDEVGRGSLAGPVTVAAALIPTSWRGGPKGLPLRDSKKLLPHYREKWYAYVKKDSRIHYRIAKVHPRTIDRINISRAANLAALRVFRSLRAVCVPDAGTISVFLDGGLYLGTKKFQKRVGIHAETIVKGDEKISAIAIASIIAKVNRDGYMTRLAELFPEYGFEIHKGYGTRRHREALRTHGASAVHRKTFLK